MKIKKVSNPRSVLIRKHNPDIEGNPAMSDTSSFMAIASSKAYAAWIVYLLSQKNGYDTENPATRKQLAQILEQNGQAMISVAQNTYMNVEAKEKAIGRLSSELDAQINKVLETFGVSEVAKKMKSALPFTVLDYNNNKALATISELEDNGQKLNLLILDVPLLSLSTEQINEYQGIKEGNTPLWYEELDDFKKSLMAKYQDKV